MLAWEMPQQAHIASNKYASDARHKGEEFADVLR